MTKFTIQYRQLKTDGLPEGLNLKDAVVGYLQGRIEGNAIGESAKRRIIDLDQDGSVVILNKITAREGWSRPIFHGQLVQLQEGANVAAVLQSLEEDADEFLLEQIDLGEQSHVVKGVLYFVVVQNHVGLLEGQAVKGRTLERYLTSILQASGAIQAGQAIILNGEFLAADGKQLDSATAITVAAEPNAHVPPEEVSRLMGREVERQQREGSTVFDVLRALGWNEDAIRRLDQEIPPDGWIEGFFSFIIKRRHRKQPISRATLNEALRNVDPADIGMDGEGRERGGIVKLSVQRTIAMNGSLKDPADAIEQIVQALRAWAEKGKIDCVFD